MKTSAAALNGGKNPGGKSERWGWPRGTRGWGKFGRSGRAGRQGELLRQRRESNFQLSVVARSE